MTDMHQDIPAVFDKQKCSLSCLVIRHILWVARKTITNK